MSVGLYQLGWSRLYSPMELSLALFLGVVFIGFAILAYRDTSVRDTKASWPTQMLPAILIGAYFTAAFIANGGVPVLMIALGQPYDIYGFGLPNLHVFMLAFTSYHALRYLRRGITARSTWNFVGYAFVVCLVASMASRSALSFIVFASAIIVIRTLKLNAIRVGLGLALLVCFLWGFGQFGNQRLAYQIEQATGQPAADDVVLAYGQATDSFMDSGLDPSWMWSYLYLSSPIANLNAAFEDSSGSVCGGSCDLDGLAAYEMLPDVVGVRIGEALDLPVFDKAEFLVKEDVNASTTFGSAAGYAGVLGAALVAALLLLTSAITARVLRGSPLREEGLAVLSTILFFSFFENMVAYSPVSLQLVIVLVASLIIRWRPQGLLGTIPLLGRRSSGAQQVRNAEVEDGGTTASGAESAGGPPSTQASRLLCVAPYVPWSGIDHAGGSYIYHYLHEFSGLGWDVHLAAPRNADNERARDELALSDPDVAVTLHDVPTRSKLVTRLVMLLSGRDGVSPGRWSDAESLAAAARGAEVIDLQWHDIYGYAGWFAEAAPGTPIVALAHDLRSQSTRRNAGAAHGAKRWSLRLALRRVVARERKELAHCSRLLAFKASDLDTAKSLGIAAPGLVAPPFIDLVHDDLAPEPTSRTMVFSAAFFRSENSEAAHWFLDEVWPLVRASVPDAQVRFAGARPPEDLLARASDDVSFTGYLPSILDGYRDALLAVAPLLRGAGLKFKVVQSMALGFPTVGTSVAMEGLEDYLPDTSLPSYDDAAGFAARVIAILTDPSAALDEAARTGAQVRGQLDFSAAMKSLSAEYLGLTGTS